MSHPFEFRENTLESLIFDIVAVQNEYRLPDAFDPDDIVVDIGAHIGSFSYSVLQRGVKHVYAFEAERSNYERVVHNLRDFADRVTIANKAVWRSDIAVDYLSFLGSPDDGNTGGGGVMVPSTTVKVAAIAFDELIRQVTQDGKRRIRMLKIDCEGAEYPILLTATSLAQIDCICGEFHELGSDLHLNEIPEHARVAGYDQFSIQVLVDLLEREGFHVVFEPSADPYMGLFFARRNTAYGIPSQTDRPTLGLDARWSRSELQHKLGTVAYWDQQIEVAPGIITHGSEYPQAYLDTLNLPADLSGMRVLDVNALDGFLSFECERRGAAEVVAFNPYQSDGFELLHQLLDSKVQYKLGTIYNLVPSLFGTFDLILCVGLLHRLKHPSLALERLRAVCHGSLILEMQVQASPANLQHHNDLPLETRAVGSQAATLADQPNQIHGQATASWWSPNPSTLSNLLLSVGFAPQQQQLHQQSICVHAQAVEPPQLNTSSIRQQRILNTPESELPSEHERSLSLLFADLNREIAIRQNKLKAHNAAIEDVEARAQWLEAIANKAQQDLHAVEQGKLMRLLRRLKPST